eukprot:g40137.t1
MFLYFDPATVREKRILMAEFWLQHQISSCSPYFFEVWKVLLKDPSVMVAKNATILNGTLKIIDRKKHIFKLAQGEYIAPEKIENIYVRSEPVVQVFVHGDSLQECLLLLLLLLSSKNSFATCAVEDFFWSAFSVAPPPDVATMGGSTKNKVRLMALHKGIINECKLLLHIEVMIQKEL